MAAGSNPAGVLADTKAAAARTVKVVDNIFAANKEYTEKRRYDDSQLSQKWNEPRMIKDRLAAGKGISTFFFYPIRSLGAPHQAETDDEDMKRHAHGL